MVTRKFSLSKYALAALLSLTVASSSQAAYTLKQKVGDIDTKLKIFGFAQLQMKGGDGALNSDTTDAPVAFSAQRIRLGVKYFAGNVRAKILIDFNQDGDKDKDSAIPFPDTIKDAFVAYKFNNALTIKGGLMKSPVGMSWTMPGWNLDNVERAFDKSLVLERAAGIMLSGRGIGYDNNKVTGLEVGHERPWKGFGYDIMVGSQAARSKAVINTSKGGGLSYMGRLMYDYTELFHVETAYGVSENAGGYYNAVTKTKMNTEDYGVANIAFDSNIDKLSLKAEYFDAQHIKGEKNYDEQVLTATAGYFVTSNLELVTKHLQGSAKKDGVSTDLSNTYLGFNFYLSQAKTDYSRSSKRVRNKHRIVANYIIADGDTADSTTKWNGLSGYKDDAFVVMYQFTF